MLNAPLTAAVSVPDDAVSVYPVPTLSMLRPLNVATPLTASTVVVPESVPPPGFVAIARVTSPVKLITVFPSASCTATRMSVRGAPACASVGPTRKANCTAPPDDTTLVYGLPPIAVPSKVIATLSVPVAMGV